MSLRLPWKHLGIPPEEEEEVAGERKAWDSLLRLLSPRPNPGRTAEDVWMEGWMFYLTAFSGLTSLKPQQSSEVTDNSVGYAFFLSTVY